MLICNKVCILRNCSPAWSVIFLNLMEDTPEKSQASCLPTVHVIADEFPIFERSIIWSLTDIYLSILCPLSRFWDGVLKVDQESLNITSALPITLPVMQVAAITRNVTQQNMLTPDQFTSVWAPSYKMGESLITYLKLLSVVLWYDISKCPALEVKFLKILIILIICILSFQSKSILSMV